MRSRAAIASVKYIALHPLDIMLEAVVSSKQQKVRYTKDAFCCPEAAMLKDLVLKFLIYE